MRFEPGTSGISAILTEPLDHGSVVASLTFVYYLDYREKLVTLSKASCEPPLQEYLFTYYGCAGILIKTNSISTRIAKIISLESPLLSELLSVSQLFSSPDVTQTKKSLSGGRYNKIPLKSS